jgi:muramoyltetrapeptide carboxypeptidase
MARVRLEPGDGIAVVAPSSPFDRERFERGVRALSSLGLVPQFSERVFEARDYLAGDDASREVELRAALEGPAKAIVLARGGYGALRFATRLDGLKTAKPIIGYSDATVLHEVWWRAGVPSIHGPMCTQLGEEASALERLRRLLFGAPAGAVEWTHRSPVQRKSRAEGILRGGNLASLASLCGTALQPDFRDAIVLLEDLNEPPYRLDRLLTQLLLSGAFDGARGFAVGDLVGPGEPSGGREEAVAERLATLDVPISFGAPFGHAGRNQPVLFGAPHALEPGRLVPL